MIRIDFPRSIDAQLFLLSLANTQYPEKRKEKKKQRRKKEQSVLKSPPSKPKNAPINPHLLSKTILPCANVRAIQHLLYLPLKPHHKALDPRPGSLLTTPTPTPPITQRKHFLPLPHTTNAPLAAAFTPSPSARSPSSHLFRRKRTLDTRAITGSTMPHTPSITILDPAHRIVRVDLAKLNLGQDHPR